MPKTYEFKAMLFRIDWKGREFEKTVEFDATDYKDARDYLKRNYAGWDIYSLKKIMEVK